jgi:putative chitinase
VIQLRLYNPFITEGRLQLATRLIAYPRAPIRELFEATTDDRLQYRVRVGDNYINLAFAFDVDVDQIRSANDLWRLQPLPAGMLLTIPFESTASFAEQRVRAGEDLDAVAARLQTDPWQLVRDNRLWDQTVEAGMVLRARQPVPAVLRATAVPARRAPAAPKYTVHRVRRGETLTGLADRYGTTIAAIQRANALGKRSLIRIGERLRIPAR